MVPSSFAVVCLWLWRFLRQGLQGLRSGGWAMVRARGQIGRGRPVVRGTVTRGSVRIHHSIYTIDTFITTYTLHLPSLESYYHRARVLLSLVHVHVIASRVRVGSGTGDVTVLHGGRSRTVAVLDRLFRTSAPSHLHQGRHITLNTSNTPFILIVFILFHQNHLIYNYSSNLIYKIFSKLEQIMAQVHRADIKHKLYWTYRRILLMLCYSYFRELLR